MKNDTFLIPPSDQAEKFVKDSEIPYKPLEWQRIIFMSAAACFGNGL